MSCMDTRANKQFEDSMCRGFRVEGLNLIRVLRYLRITGAVSGSAKDPGWKYLWVKENEPGFYTKIYKWVDAQQYLTYRASGTLKTTRDDASLTFLYNVKKREWSKSLCEMLGVDMAHLPDLYTVVLVMTVGFAIAQPFILNAPGLVAGKWFPENERATANGVGLLANYLGMGTGPLLTPLLLDGGMAIRTILLIYGIAATVGAALFLVFAKEKPPTPPCSEEDAHRASFKEGFRIVMKRKYFLIILVVFFFMLGVFNTFFTMIEPIISSMTGGKVDPTGAGIVGVAILIAGSLVISAFSDRDKRHRRLPYMIVCNIAGVIGFGLFILLNGFPGMLASGLLYGFFTIGSAPVVPTFAAEAAYPVSEGTSEGLLMFAGNVGGVIFLGIASLFGANHLSIMILMTAISALCIGLMLLAKETKPENKLKTGGIKKEP